jgi:hypothetical protein
MQLPRYELTAESDLCVFEFISEGPKGNIHKLIKFSETALKDFFNLAFGDKDLLNGEIDDKVVSNNGDSERILATIVSAIYAFTDREKDAWVYATGSTGSRTRLYRMGVTKYIDEAKQDFHVFGLYNGEWEDFTKDIAYTAFLVKRK